LIYDNAGVFDHVSVMAKIASDNLADVVSESWEWRLPDSKRIPRISCMFR